MRGQFINPVLSASRSRAVSPRATKGDEGRGVRGTVAEDWPAMRPLVVCGDGAMTLSAQGRAYAHLLVDRGTASPVPLFHLPASCGYSVESSLQKLVLKAKYDGCHVIHENGSYVLPLLWWGVQVKVSCPDVPKLKSSAPLAFCCTSGIVLKAMGPKESDFLFSLLLAPFEGLYTLDIMSDGLTFRLTCPPEFGPLPPPYPTSPVHQTTLTPSQPSSASPADDTFYPPFSNFYIPPPLHPPSLHPTVLPPLFPHDSGLPPYYYSGYRADPYFYLPAPSRTQPSVPQSFQNFPFPNAPPHYFHPYYNYVYPGHKPTEDPLQPKPPRQPVTRTPTKADVPPHRFSLPAPGQRPARKMPSIPTRSSSGIQAPCDAVLCLPTRVPLPALPRPASRANLCPGSNKRWQQRPLLGRPFLSPGAGPFSSWQTAPSAWVPSTIPPLCPLPTTPRRPCATRTSDRASETDCLRASEARVYARLRPLAAGPLAHLYGRLHDRLTPLRHAPFHQGQR
uniref:Uncharacterized protein n=1 Tax=Denticeps clupeoides TaxID=299321 RepID=A0AAY4ACW9_9TELE